MNSGWFELEVMAAEVRRREMLAEAMRSHGLTVPRRRTLHVAAWYDRLMALPKRIGALLRQEAPTRRRGAISVDCRMRSQEGSKGSMPLR